MGHYLWMVRVLQKSVRRTISAVIQRTLSCDKMKIHGRMPWQLASSLNDLIAGAISHPEELDRSSGISGQFLWLYWQELFLKKPA
jgi:hypothetical protein